VDCIAETAKNLGMCINVSRTEIQYLGHGSNNFQIYINGQQLQQTDNFVYLGGNVGTHDGVDSDINRRIGLARTVFQMLRKVWSSTNISNATKLKVYETMVLSVLMYNSETWTLKQTQENRLRVFEISSLRRIAGVTRRDRIRNKEVCDRVGLLEDVANRIQQRRIQYFCHANNGSYEISETGTSRICAWDKKTRKTQEEID